MYRPVKCQPGCLPAPARLAACVFDCLGGTAAAALRGRAALILRMFLGELTRSLSPYDSTAAAAVAAVAALGVLAVVGWVASSAPVRMELMDKQQAAWWGAPHKDGNGNWDQGWLARYVGRNAHGNRGREDADSQQLAAAPNGNKAELDEIHSLLNTAVGMLGAMQGGKNSQTILKDCKDCHRAPATLPQERRIKKVTHISCVNRV
jgi:hypothetical protein